MDEIYFLRLLAALAVFSFGVYAVVKWLNYLSDSKPVLTVTYNDEVEFSGLIKDVEEMKEIVQEVKERVND